MCNRPLTCLFQLSNRIIQPMNSIDNDTVVENHHPPSCGEEPADGEDALSKKGGSLILETAQSMGRVLDVDSNRGKSSSGGLEEHKYSWLESFFLACKIRYCLLLIWGRYICTNQLFTIYSTMQICN